MLLSEKDTVATIVESIDTYLEYISYTNNKFSVDCE